MDYCITKVNARSINSDFGVVFFMGDLFSYPEVTCSGFFSLSVSGGGGCGVYPSFSWRMYPTHGSDFMTRSYFQFSRPCMIPGLCDLFPQDH